MKNKNKLIIIAGILIIFAGVASIAYPLINQAISASKQKKIMDEVKKDIILNNAAVTPEPEATSAPTPGAGDIEGSGSGTDDLSSINFTDINLTENENSTEEGYDRSRLSGQKCVGIISCDKINLVYAIVEGVDDDNIGVAIGHFPDSAAIGAEGNCALAGHNGGTYGRYFGDIKDLEKDDPIVLTDLNGYEYTYKVTKKFVVDPLDVYVVEDLGVSGKYLTLVTCTEHGKRRLIVRALCTEEPVKMRGL